MNIYVHVYNGNFFSWGVFLVYYDLVCMYDQINAVFYIGHASQMVEDPLQARRLKFAFESEKGLLGT